MNAKMMTWVAVIIFAVIALTASCLYFDSSLDPIFRDFSLSVFSAMLSVVVTLIIVEIVLNRSKQATKRPLQLLAYAKIRYLSYRFCMTFGQTLGIETHSTDLIKIRNNPKTRFSEWTLLVIDEYIEKISKLNDNDFKLKPGDSSRLLGFANECMSTLDDTLLIYAVHFTEVELEKVLLLKNSLYDTIDVLEQIRDHHGEAVYNSSNIKQTLRTRVLHALNCIDVLRDSKQFKSLEIATR